MAHRIEVASTLHDSQADALTKRLHALGLQVEVSAITNVYTVRSSLPVGEMTAAAKSLAHPVMEQVAVNRWLAPVLHIPRTNETLPAFDWAVEIGWKPGVRDTVAETARTVLEDSLQQTLGDDSDVFTSQVLYLRGGDEGVVRRVAAELSNPLIQRTHLKDVRQFIADNGMDVIEPRVHLAPNAKAYTVDLELPDEELVLLGKKGVPDFQPDGTVARDLKGEIIRRGPPALSLEQLHVIRDYVRMRGRPLTDIEFESLAQTWSEHCKHTIFASPIDEYENGLFKTLIRDATGKIRAERNKKGLADICESVFTDNAGGIVFDDNHLVTLKVETHNSPSALDPFGGSITGIVGVNRDAIGFGLGAKPILNTYGFCLADPEDNSPLYRSADKTQQLLSPRRIMEGVIAGVNSGGNQSGIPTPQGFLLFEERYKGKPLVFVGTTGLIPREVNGKPSYEKQAQPGDYIVMVGGRVGMDGIHGATFSSEALDSGSPATAVQIGAPITQKRLSDAIVKEARDLGLYNSITDNGAGGLSCSVAEMAKECGGCRVDLEKVPLKYAGLAPWQIWISEAQERMTLAVPQEKWGQFEELMRRRGVEATVIGEFNDNGRCIVDYDGKRVMDVEMDFLHDGVPLKHIHTAYTKQTHEEPMVRLEEATESLFAMIARKNIASTAFVSQQYDHEVQGGSVLKPLQGKGRVNGDAVAIRPLLDSRRTLIQSQGLLPTYSDINTYRMAAASIDTAVRNAVAAGADIDHMALLDNFCWCSSEEPERLGQLKAAVQACHDYSIAYGTPFVSGKDSMFNDFKGFDENGAPVKISVPPTLLVSAASVIHEDTKVVSIDVKAPGDLVYVLGRTDHDLGGSEFLAMHGEETRGKAYIGNSVPEVDADRNASLYRALHKAMDEELVASSISVGMGGLAVALAKTAMAGEHGLDIDLRGLPGNWHSVPALLYSESQGRIVVTIDPANKRRFEELLEGSMYTRVGEVSDEKRLMISGEGQKLVDASIDDLLHAYKSTFEGY